MSLLAIVNGASAGGKTGRRWPEIERALAATGIELETRFTEGRGHAIELVGEALAEGRNELAACGGDGTLSEVVNGLIDRQGVPRASGTRLAIIPSGTGGDFRKTLKLPTDPSDLGKLIASGRTRTIDAGLIEFAGGEEPRRFVNIASCGVGYEVDRRVNELKFKPGKLAYALVSGATIMRFKPVTATLCVDGTELTGTFISISLANGQYFGGGMHIAPEADPADGLLDVVLSTTTRSGMITGSRRLYAGSHLEAPGSVMLRGRTIEITPAEGVTIGFDIDGEALGRCPATVRALPGVLEVYC